MTKPVAIVGAGPVGIELAVALKRRAIPYLHFDAKQVGSTMFWWPPQTRWFSSNDRISIAGVPLQTADQSKATREDYLRYLRDVVVQFDLDVRTYEPVTAIERRGDGDFVLRTAPLSGPCEHEVRAIVLATGGTAWPRRLNVPGEDLPHVTHDLGDPHRFFRRKVLVVGGKNSAVEAAIRLHQIGAHVALSYRRPELPSRSIKYWLMPEIAGLIKSGQVPFYAGTVVRQITPTHVALAAYVGDDVPPAAGEPTTNVEADFVLLMVGYEADMSLFRSVGVELVGKAQSPAHDPRTMMTSVPGIYVAGTAIAGTQDGYRVFLENCHVHASRIVASLTGEAPPEDPTLPAAPES